MAIAMLPTRCRRRLLPLILLLPLGLSACGDPTRPQRAQTLLPLGVEVLWRSEDACSRRAPAFRIAGLPAATSSLQFSLRRAGDKEFLYVAALPAPPEPQIPAGQFLYRAPCDAAPADWEWQVQALDAQAVILAEGLSRFTVTPRQ